MSEEITVKKEMNLREWYTNATKAAFRALIVTAVIVAIAAILLWNLADLPFLARMQTFNGAIVIPAAGGIWIAAFMYIWLIPMRELSFRGQESFDRTEARLQKALEEDLAPVAKVWLRIGEQVEKDLLPRLEKVVAQAEERIGPVSESVRRLENQVTGQIGVLAADVKDATASIKGFFGPQGAPADLEGAAGMMSTPRNGQPVIPARRV